MSAEISITEDALVEAVGAYVSAIVGDVPVVRGQQNRVPSPAGDYVYITPIQAPALSLPHTIYADDGTDGSMTLKRPTQWTAQVDCYGERAQDMAMALSVGWRSGYACDLLAERQCQPLNASDPRQVPFITGESQYLERWSIDLMLQFNPSITVPQQFADQLEIGLINVTVAYPGGQ